MNIETDPDSVRRLEREREAIERERAALKEEYQREIVASDRISSIVRRFREHHDD